MEEASPNKRWLEGPLARESLDSLFEGEWSPCRRFAVWQANTDPLTISANAVSTPALGVLKKSP